VFLRLAAPAAFCRRAPEFMKMKLEMAGWNGFWAKQFADFASQGLRPARVLAQHRGSYLLWTENGEAGGEVAGALLFRAAPGELPVTGDWVAIRQYSPADVAIITDVASRKTSFSRKASGRAAEEQVIAANIDLLFIVCGLDNDYNLRRLERYLVAARQSGAKALIVLNKADLCPEEALRVREVQGIAAGVQVLAITATDDVGPLFSFIGRGETAALVGSSGAGKSTIVNQLVGSAVQSTHPARASDSRGRHTTTHRELFFLPNGGLILDNPGIRELQLWAGDLGQSSLPDAIRLGNAFAEAFPEVAALGAQCGFRDCSHGSEPGCAVQSALATGMIDDARWRSYVKLRRELRHATLAADKNLRRTEKQRFKKACKDVKRNQKWR
jgi:ribosome biogenesis GTPase / thiamine phosphate phosphatase